MDPDTILMRLRTANGPLARRPIDWSGYRRSKESDFPTPPYRRRRRSGSRSSGACPARSTGIDCPSAFLKEESTCMRLAAISSLTNNFTGAAAKLLNLCCMHKKGKNYFAVQSGLGCWNIHSVQAIVEGLNNLDHWPKKVSVVFIPSNIMLHGLIGDGDCPTMFEISAPEYETL
ncbi:hypothetical protein MUK42_35336, partial [Musa troglodytarum]